MPQPDAGRGARHLETEMINPYHVAAVRKQQALRALHLPPAQPEGVNFTQQMNDFLDATAINHGGNRAKICTGIAHRMSDRKVKGESHQIWRTQRVQVTLTAVTLYANF